MPKTDQISIRFLQWALPKLGYRWRGFRKPRNQVLKRIHQRITELNLNGYEDYKTYLAHYPEEWKELDALLYVTISRFFRDRKLWDELSKALIPKLAEKRHPEKVRIWSAGCCNGEEPYSIAIAADRCGHIENVDILATDRQASILKRAEKGVYTESSLKELTPAERKNYFEQSDGSGEYKLKPQIKKVVTFEKRNILESWPQKKFDLIFCRYLAFTYFDHVRQQNIIEHFRSSLPKHGFLITGNNEKLPDSSNLVQPYPPLPIYGTENHI